MDALAALIADQRAARAARGAPAREPAPAPRPRKRPRRASGDGGAEDAGGSRHDGDRGDADNNNAAAAALEVAAEEEKQQELTREEVVRRLRARGEPVTLFGEEDAARLARLRLLEKQNLGADEHKGTKLTGMLAASSGAGASEKASGLDATAGSGADNAKEADGKDRTREDREVTADDVVNKKTAEKRVLAFMKLTLGDWSREVEAMDAAQRRSSTGRKEAQTLKQTQDHLRPLKKLLKNKQVAPEVLQAVDRMVQLCMKKEYTQAADQYVRLAIGNDPWPIGVTMVGIHERKGRERINAGKVAHVMNDEAQRKYLTSLKRLLTFRQKTHPADPSKMLQ